MDDPSRLHVWEQVEQEAAERGLIQGADRPTAWIVYTNCDGHGEAVHSIHLTEMGAYSAMKGWMQEGDMKMAEWDRVRGKTYQDKRMYQWESWGDESWKRRGADSVRIEQMELSQ